MRSRKGACSSRSPPSSASTQISVAGSLGAPLHVARTGHHAVDRHLVFQRQAGHFVEHLAGEVPNFDLLGKRVGRVQVGERLVNRGDQQILAVGRNARRGDDARLAEGRDLAAVRDPPWRAAKWRSTRTGPRRAGSAACLRASGAGAAPPRLSCTCGPAGTGGSRGAGPRLGLVISTSRVLLSGIHWTSLPSARRRVRHRRRTAAQHAVDAHAFHFVGLAGGVADPQLDAGSGGVGESEMLTVGLQRAPLILGLGGNCTAISAPSGIFRSVSALSKTVLCSPLVLGLMRMPAMRSMGCGQLRDGRIAHRLRLQGKGAGGLSTSMGVVGAFRTSRMALGGFWYFSAAQTDATRERSSKEAFVTGFIGLRQSYGKWRSEVNVVQGARHSVEIPECVGS